MNEPISPANFEFIASLLKKEAAIHLEKGKEYLVESRLEPLAKSLGHQGIPELIEFLKTKPSPTIKQKIIEALTTHETSFFRDFEPFEILRTNLLPQLLKSQEKSRELTIWCGASSSGQEPYSICMVLREHFPQISEWKVRIIATDISSTILQRARAGSYSQLEVNRGLPARYLVKYFDKDGEQWILKPEIRNMVEFFEQNLLHPFLRIPPVDLVFLRNVLIYFDLLTKQQILAKIRALLRSSGFLVLGTAESMINIDSDFDRVAFGKCSCYRKRS